MTLRRLRIIVLLSVPMLALAWPAAPGLAQTKPGLPAAQVSAIDTVFAAYDSRTSPGCAAAVVRDGATVFEKGYGMSDFQHDVPISPASIFHVASISKQFTAMSILVLARDGKLSLDDDVRKYLPEAPDLGHRITIRHLIHHTSGLRDQWQLLGLSGWRADDPKSEDDILWLVSRQRALNFVPGAEHLYSNTGYTLLGTIVRRVTGQTLREFTSERLFKPLGMADTHFHDDHTMIVPGRTSAYTPRPTRGGGAGRAGGEGPGGAPASIDGFRISLPVFDNAGATSLFTTVRDLAKWDANFYRPIVGDAALIEQMHERGVLNSGTAIPYAFALSHGTYRGLRTVGHGGADAGYRADFVRFPDERTTFITLCNVSTANPSQLNRRMAEAVLGDRMAPAPPAPAPAGPSAPRADAPKDAPIDAALLQRIAGTYLNRTTEAGGQISWRAATGTLHLGTGANAPRLVHLGDRVFALEIDLTSHLRVVLTDDGSGVAAIEDVRANARMDRMAAPVVTPDRLRELAGRYRSEELDVEWTLRAAEDGAFMLERRRLPGQRLTPLYEDGFSGGVGSLRFTRDSGGRVTGFLLTSGRVRHMQFDRVR